MLHLNFAPSADLLIPKLLEKIRTVWRDPFYPPTVIVPSPALGKWLRMQLAAPDGRLSEGVVEVLGCVANLEMSTLEKYLWRTLKPDADMQILDGSRFAQVICGLLEPELLCTAGYEPLRAYLSIPGSDEPDPLKRVQLSARIASQFLEYEYNRPGVWDEERRAWRHEGIDGKWLKGKTSFEPGSAHEPWQKALYVLADECIQRFKAVHYISLPRLYRLRRENGNNSAMAWQAQPGALFLFGLTKVSHFHRNSLVEISQMNGVEMDVFLTNPCAEFWEQVDTRRSRKSRKGWSSTSVDAAITPRSQDDYSQENLDFAHLPPDHKLLELWGGAGKENIFLWCPQALWNFEYYSPGWVEQDHAPKTLLKSLQYSLLRCDNTLTYEQSAAHRDHSLQILACPDRGREIEEIRELILDMVYEKRVSFFNEIVIYLPDPDAYVPFIQRVFGSSRPERPDYIPFTILGASGSDSIFAQGVTMFLALIEGRFNRATVFELLRNPIVQASRGISPRQIAVWEQWAEALGIYRGFNRTHREQVMGDTGQAVTDAHTFELGMARMLIGGLAADPVQMDFNIEKDGKNLISPFRDFETADGGTLEMFCSIMTELNNDCALVRACVAGNGNDNQSVILADALERIMGVVRKWFGTIPAENIANPADEGKVYREFISALPVVNLQHEVAGRKNIPLAEFLALIHGCLPGELGTVSSAWVGGITFVPLRSAMIVPHRVVFVAGLDALSFPGTSDKPAWDLLSKHHIVGDSDPVRDNRFAFLELVHAARERLILSYRARDMQKEEDLQPSSVVLELEAYLKNPHGKATVATAEIDRRIPWIIHESLHSACSAGRSHGTWDRVARALDHSIQTVKPVAHRHDLPGRPTACLPALVDGTQVSTSLYGIRKFFANPLEYHLVKTLGIDPDDDAATNGATDDPLDSGNLSLSSMQKAVWATLLRALFPPVRPDQEICLAELGIIAAAAAEQIYGDHVAQGQSPEAQFGAMEKQALMHWSQECCRKTILLIESFCDHRLIQNGDLSMGRTGVAGMLFVDIAGNTTVSIECRHQLALIPRVWNAAHNTIGIITVKKEGKSIDNADLWLAGLLQRMAEHGIHSRNKIALVQLNRGDAKDKKAGISQGVMKDAGNHENDIDTWFRQLLKSMLIERCSDHLPFEIVRKIFNGDWANICFNAVTDQTESDYSPYRCYNESFKLVDARIPFYNETNVIERDRKLAQTARQRFAPMLEGWIHE